MKSAGGVGGGGGDKLAVAVGAPQLDSQAAAPCTGVALGDESPNCLLVDRIHIGDARGD